MMICRKRYLRFATCFLAAALISLFACHDYASAQGIGASLGSFIPVQTIGSYAPLTTLETYCGPILPKCGIANTFRSEFGVGAGLAQLQSVKLSGSLAGDIDLNGHAALDDTPPYFDIYADLRLWRFGFRGKYLLFDTKSFNHRLGKVEWNGLDLGVDLDAIQFPWLTLGACVDFYFINPRFNGRFFGRDQASGAVITSGQVTTNAFPPVIIDINGSRPITWGMYLRYMPPEILGFPLHVEAFYNLPLSGSKFTSYGLSLVFRPQIYRFDLACKLGVEWGNLKFSQFTQASSNNDPNDPRSPFYNTPQNWELDMGWNFYKIELAAYF
ncbi:MAG TPA: hypothetical protein VMC85_08130 [Desulfomonilaceae bacterium]|nr:hypothetical protein [Desulfomonilaceae bacterium]